MPEKRELLTKTQLSLCVYTDMQISDGDEIDKENRYIPTPTCKETNTDT